MKVPTYEAQLQRPRQGQGQFLTAQLSASAMAAPARAFAESGQQLAKAGADVAAFGIKKAQVSADSEAKARALQLEVAMADVETKAAREASPQAAEQAYLTGVSVLNKQYSANLNTMTRRAFSGEAARINAASRIRFMKANNARVVEARKTNLTTDTNSSISRAADLSLSFDGRFAAALEGQQRITDALSDLGEKEVQARIDTYYEDLVQNTLSNLINGPDADVLSIVEQFRRGKLSDAIIQGAAKNLTPERIDAIAKAATKQANEIVKVRTSLREQKEAEDNRSNDQLYRSIVNVNPDNPKAVEKAKTDLNTLLSAGYFDKPSQVDAVIRSLEAESEGGAFPKKSAATDSVEAELDEKESLNQLSFEELLANKGKVTKDWYRGMLNTLEGERGEAETDAINEFKDVFRYTEAADKELLGTPARQAFMQLRRDIRRFIRKNPRASYQQVMKEADRLIKLQKPRFVAKFEAFKAETLKSQYTLLSPALKGRIPNPSTASLEEVQSAVSKELAAGSTDMILVGFNKALNEAFDLRIFD